MRPVFLLLIQETVLWILAIHLLNFGYAAVTLWRAAYAETFQKFLIKLFLKSLSSRLLLVEWGKTRVQTPHCFVFSAKLRFVLCCFHSPLLTASQLLSFPGRNKMFQFWPFALPCGSIQDVPFGNSRFEDCMRLAETFGSLPPPSSPPEPSHPPNTMGASYLYLRTCDRFICFWKGKR